MCWKYFTAMQSNHIFLNFNSLDNHKLAVILNLMQFYLAKVESGMLNCSQMHQSEVNPSRVKNPIDILA